MIGDGVTVWDNFHDDPNNFNLYIIKPTPWNINSYTISTGQQIKNKNLSG